MKLAALGLNHRSAPVEIRERLAFTPEQAARALEMLRSQAGVSEAVVLSTCNRVELYACRPDEPIHFRDLQAFLARFHQLPEEQFSSCLYKYRDAEAIEHLFLVACSGDSMVLGETQILSQVKEAYRVAAQAGMAGPLLGRLFQHALAVGKEVHTLTGIGKLKISVSSVAVDFAEKIFTSLAGRTLLVLGAGKVSELTLKHMVHKGVQTILVSNRTPEKAEQLARAFGGRSLPFELMLENLTLADIVISSTGSPKPIIHPQQVREALRRRRHQPMFLIDIAVPRDIDPAVNEMDNVFLYDIDDLEKAVAENRAARQSEILECRRLVAERVDQFVNAIRIRDAGPVIARLTEKVHQMRQQELERTLNKLGALSAKDREEIEYMTKRIINKLLNSPISTIRQEVAKGDGHRILDAAEKLFDLDSDSEEAAKDEGKDERLEPGT
ncbi:MAG: glutamyl-tRNA reductase [Planctomycetes bacterium]|nr:glutamyl-tRNA reductase [Planctomycetota bacterium]